MSAAFPPSRRHDVKVRALVGEHFDFIWRLLRRLGLSAEDADDATQHVFMTALPKIENITPGSERSFLYGVALRVHANARRKRLRRREDPLDAQAFAVDDGSQAETTLELARARARLDELLDELPEELARVFVLCVIEELSMAEVAVLEGIPAGTVASRLRRARSALADGLRGATRSGGGGAER
jgi:RNA polymerase sigma-70 factor (ECF subfamily)